MSSMGKTKGKYKPRSIDRAVFAILAAVCLINGGYVVGPWYLHTDAAGERAPLASMFNNDAIVTMFGFVLILLSAALIYAAASSGENPYYTRIVSNALLLGFLLRLYSLIGVMLTLQSWRPPNYSSHAATVAIFGAYWVWVKVNERLVE